MIATHCRIIYFSTFKAISLISMPKAADMPSSVDVSPLSMTQEEPSVEQPLGLCPI